MLGLCIVTAKVTIALVGISLCYLACTFDLSVSKSPLRCKLKQTHRFSGAHTSGQRHTTFLQRLIPQPPPQTPQGSATSMSEITGHNARLAHCDEFVIRRTEDRTLRNPQNEIEGIERATAQLKLQAEAFQQDLLSRLRDPNVKGRQQVASMLCSRLESEARLCGEKEKLLTECRELCGGLDGLERNIAIDVGHCNQSALCGHMTLADKRFWCSNLQRCFASFLSSETAS